MKGKGKPGGEQRWATDHAHVLSCIAPQCSLDGGIQAAGNVETRALSRRETWHHGRVWRERVFEALESEEVAKEKVTRLQRSPQLGGRGRGVAADTAKEQLEQKETESHSQGGRARGLTAGERLLGVWNALGHFHSSWPPPAI